MQNQANMRLNRKELAAYYTSPDVTSALCDWAIRSPAEHILEPSFGGCGFLESAVSRLAMLGCKRPHEFLYGCDIDSQAFSHLSELKITSTTNRRFLLADFMTVLPEDFLRGEFDVVIGNPPYISHHNFSEQQKNSIAIWRELHQDVNIDARSSLWAYFVLHSLSFLKKHGRMAWVLPGSLLQANYGKKLRNQLKEHFQRVDVIRVGDRIFLAEGTEERTVLLLCDGYGTTNELFRDAYCDTIVDLSAMLRNNLRREVNVGIQDNSSVFHRLNGSTDAVAFEKIARVLIGTVTGANQFFVISQSKADSIGLSDRYLRPILGRLQHASGAMLTAEDMELLRNQDRRCLLFHVPNNNISFAALAYMETFPVEARKKNRTFQKRQNRWLDADDGRVPDAFLSYMIHGGPRLVLNGARVNATNSIHRVFFHADVDQITRKLAVISLCTTFSQISAEVEGRSYGSGVLKIEPSEARKIRLLLPKDKPSEDIDEVLNRIDTLLRAGDADRANIVADEFIFGCRVLEEDMKKLRLELLEHRRRRQRNASLHSPELA